MVTRNICYFIKIIDENHGFYGFMDQLSNIDLSLCLDQGEELKSVVVRLVYSATPARASVGRKAAALAEKMRVAAGGEIFVSDIEAVTQGDILA